MTRALTYVEIDIPTFGAFSPDITPGTETFRFTKDTDYLPNTISAIPSIKEIAIQPQTISLGEDLGQRGIVTITFNDHLHSFASESFTAGSFWGKFRGRYGQTLQGRDLRLYRGTLGQTLEEMETRYYTIDSTDGPNTNREYKIIAKDALFLAKAAQAQAPVYNSGFVSVTINAVTTTLTLAPTGIGNAEYPSSGYVNVGGKEIMSFTRAGNTLTVVRGLLNTTAQAHDAESRVQNIAFWEVDRPVDIIYDLLVNYTDIDASLISQSEWQAENDAYLNVFYTGYVADPRGVDVLVSEILQQAGLAIWWDDVGQMIRLQVLREIPTTAQTFDGDSTLQGTLEVTEQPEKRLSEVQVYFAKINPLVQDDEDDNYRSSTKQSDSTAVTEYGSAQIKKIRSRWIPTGGRTSAETTANKQLGRFRDPPRNIKFSLPRDQPTNPALGGGYQLQGYPFQTSAGVADTVPIQIVRLNPKAERFDIEAEEMLFTQFGAVVDPLLDTVIFDVNANNVNLETVHDSLYAVAVSGDVVRAFVNAGVIIGSTSTSAAAFEVGNFVAGVTVQLFVNGRIQGCGGVGGVGGDANSDVPSAGNGTAGGAGGTALYTRRAILLTSTSGQIWGGGGGGGGDGGTATAGILAEAGDGGSGGAGTNAGAGGAGGVASGTIGPPTLLQGTAGAGGSAANGGHSFGGAGGNPGANGGAGSAGSAGGDVFGSGGAGGAAGNSIDGISFVTHAGPAGSELGPQVN